jgi:hypothetical protein
MFAFLEIRKESFRVLISGLGVWFKWYSTCYPAQGPEFKAKYGPKKKLKG